MTGEDRGQYWDNLYSSLKESLSGEADWLDKFEEILSADPSGEILDLGCGRGYDSLYLLNRGYSVLSCDISPVALESLAARDDRARVRCFDMSKGLPLADGTASVVVADLSLHYFFWEETLFILKEIDRVLSDSGYLLCRLNSVNDGNFGAGAGRERERHFYEEGGHFKRFFDREDLLKLFGDWQILTLEENVTERYGKPKSFWECSLRKKEKP
ncbi:MAG: methyltransferase domain-containing protein [Spirochaetales bacterium]|nr:methyltransferase domain-containing protein [Spirochaetales bacterium]